MLFQFSAPEQPVKITSLQSNTADAFTVSWTVGIGILVAVNVYLMPNILHKIQFRSLRRRLRSKFQISENHDDLPDKFAILY